MSAINQQTPVLAEVFGEIINKLIAMERVRKTTLFLLVNLLFYAGQAQDYEWANQIQEGRHEPYVIAADHQGYIYVSGYFVQQIALCGDTTISHGNTGNGAGNFYLAKMDTLGNCIWARFGYAEGHVYGSSVTVDDDGNVIAIGTFQDTINIGGTLLETEGNWDNFIVKYNASGDMLWVTSIGGTHQDLVYAVETDHDENIYVAGYPSSSTLLVQGIECPKGGYVAKFDSSGMAQWAKSFSTHNLKDIEIDTENNLYVSGVGLGVDSNACTTDNEASPTQQLFVSKVSSSGSCIWSASAAVHSGGSLDGGVIAIHETGSVYVTGAYGDTMDFGSIQLVEDDGFGNQFLAKLDGSGNWLWAKSTGGAASIHLPGIFGVGSLEADALGNLYIIGNVGGITDSIQFDTSSYWIDGGYLAKYDSNGNFLWVKATKPANSLSTAEFISVGVDQGGQIFVTGQIVGVVSFDTITLGASISNTFIFKIGQPHIRTEDPGTDPEGVTLIDNNQLGGVLFFPNPASDRLMVQFSQPAVRFQVFDLTGRVIVESKDQSGTLALDVSNWESSTYLFQAIHPDGTISKGSFIVN